MLYMKEKGGEKRTATKLYPSIAGAMISVTWQACVKAVRSLCVWRHVPLVTLSKGSHKVTLVTKKKDNGMKQQKMPASDDSMTEICHI